MSIGRRERVAVILDGEDATLGRSVAFAIQALIALSAISVAIETLPGLPEWAARVLAIEEAAIVVVFTVEYALRVWSAPNRIQYVLGFWGIIDLLAILPSLFMLGTDLRAVRSIRLLRLLRLFKLARYNRAADRLAAALYSVRAELVLFLFISIITLYICSVGIFYFEHEAQPEAFASIPHSFWWSVATLTTVGYGDVYPITAGGRIFTFFVLMVGLGTVAVPTGLVATALSNSRSDANDNK
jgi:voltage-gated potassium channel